MGLPPPTFPSFQVKQGVEALQKRIFGETNKHDTMPAHWDFIPAGTDKSDSLQAAYQWVGSSDEENKLIEFVRKIIKTQNFRVAKETTNEDGNQVLAVPKEDLERMWKIERVDHTKGQSAG